MTPCGNRSQQLKSLFYRNLASLLIALTVAPASLVSRTTHANQPRQPAQDWGALLGDGLPRYLPQEQVSLEALSQLESNAEQFKIELSQTAPDDGYVFAHAQLARWLEPVGSSPGQTVATPGDSKSRYLVLLKRTAIEEALRARGLLYLLIGGERGVQDYLRTYEDSGKDALKAALCELEPNHAVCQNGGKEGQTLSFALPCNVKSLFGIYDERCPSRVTQMFSPNSNAGRLLREQDESNTDKFKVIRNAETFLNRSEPTTADYRAQDGTQYNAAQLRNKILGNLIFHSLQLVQMQRVIQYFHQDYPQALAQSFQQTYSDNTNPNPNSGQGHISAGIEDARRVIARKYARQIERTQLAINTIISTVPFLGVRIGERPFYLFLYCFLQGSTQQNENDTNYCGRGHGFPDFYTPLSPSPEAASRLYYSNQTEIELPTSFTQPFSRLMADIESGSNSRLENQIMASSQWPMKRLLTQALAANTLTLENLASTEETTLQNGVWWNMTQYCRVIGARCQILQNLARFDALHEKTKMRFGTYNTAPFLSSRNRARGPMDDARHRILEQLRPLDRLDDSIQRNVRNGIDVFLWGVTAVQLGTTFAIGAAVHTTRLLATRAALTGTTLVGLATSYGAYSQSLTRERYLNTLYQGIPNQTVSHRQLDEAINLRVDDAVQFHASIAVAAGDFFVLDAVMRSAGMILDAAGTSARFVLTRAGEVVFRNRTLRDLTTEMIRNSRRLSETRGIIRPILTNRAIRALEEISHFGSDFAQQLPPELVTQRVAQLEGRSIDWVRSKVGERATQLMLSPDRALQRFGEQLHDYFLSREAMVAGNREGFFGGGVRGWINRRFGRNMDEAIRLNTPSFLRKVEEAELRIAEERMLQWNAAQRVALTQGTEEYTLQLNRLRRHLTADERLSLLRHLQTTSELDYTITVPFLRSLIREEAWSVGVLTYMNVMRRIPDGWDATDSTLVASDAAMDMWLMFFVAMRSPSRVDAVSGVRPEHVRQGLRIAHPYARSATMVSPVVAIASAAGALVGAPLQGDDIDTPEEWMHYIRQSRNRMLFDVGYVSMFAPGRAAVRESVTEAFSGYNILGRLVTNGYCAFDFGILTYPLYLGVRDFLELDRLPEHVRTLVAQSEGGNLFMSVREPGAPDPDFALNPTVDSIFDRFSAYTGE